MNERELFLSALEFDDPAKRRAHLQSMCRDDVHLLRRIESLLASHTSNSQFLQVPVAEQLLENATIATGTGSTHDDDAARLVEPVPGPEQTLASDGIPLGFLEPSSRRDSLGRLGHYEILEIIGRGAFGTVLRAFDDKLQRVVAIKVMALELASSSPARKRFLREAQSSAQIRHEHVVSVYAVEEKPLPYLVMEYIPGMTLQERLDERGPLDVPTVLRLGVQIAEGLAAAHALNLIHRDIKPGNILLETGVGDRAKITDFGLARAADDASMTQSGTIAGTPMYMAPEQALGHKLDQRADLFSFGTVLYQMVSGRPPFRASTTLAVLKRLTEDTPRPIQEIIPETPQWLCDVISKLHAKSPADRYQSAREVADVLADCNAQRSQNSRLSDFSRMPRSTARGQHLKFWMGIAAGLLLSILALALAESAGVTDWIRTEASVAESIKPGEWIDVISLIDPQRDKWNNSLTGVNAWRIEGDELVSGYADDKPCKLLLPLDSSWQAFECEVEFTRRTGTGGFILNIPTAVGECPAVIRPPNNPGIYLGRRGGGAVLNQAFELQTGKRTALRLEVHPKNNHDHVSVWVNDTEIGTWQGDRTRIAATANEGYPHARRMSVWIPTGEFVFHRIRVRMLHGGTAEALRPVSNSPRPAIAPLACF